MAPEGQCLHLWPRKDSEYLKIIKDFNQFDLYTKSQKIHDLEDVLEYYQPIAEKYLGNEPIYW